MKVLVMVTRVIPLMQDFSKNIYSIKILFTLLERSHQDLAEYI